MRGSVASACLCRRPGLNAFRIHLVTLRYNWKRKTVIVFLHKLSKCVNRHRKKPDDAPEALSLGMTPGSLISAMTRKHSAFIPTFGATKAVSGRSSGRMARLRCRWKSFGLAKA